MQRDIRCNPELRKVLGYWVNELYPKEGGEILSTSISIEPSLQSERTPFSLGPICRFGKEENTT